MFITNELYSNTKDKLKHLNTYLLFYWPKIFSICWILDSSLSTLFPPKYNTAWNNKYTIYTMYENDGNKTACRQTIIWTFYTQDYYLHFFLHKGKSLASTSVWLLTRRKVTSQTENDLFIRCIPWHLKLSLYPECSFFTWFFVQWIIMECQSCTFDIIMQITEWLMCYSYNEVCPACDIWEPPFKFDDISWFGFITCGDFQMNLEFLNIDGQKNLRLYMYYVNAGFYKQFYI